MSRKGDFKEELGPVDGGRYLLGKEAEWGHRKAIWIEQARTQTLVKSLC